MAEGGEARGQPRASCLARESASPSLLPRTQQPTFRKRSATTYRGMATGTAPRRPLPDSRVDSIGGRRNGDSVRSMRHKREALGGEGGITSSDSPRGGSERWRASAARGMIARWPGAGAPPTSTDASYVGMSRRVLGDEVLSTARDHRFGTHACSDVDAVEGDAAASFPPPLRPSAIIWHHSVAPQHTTRHVHDDAHAVVPDDVAQCLPNTACTHEIAESGSLFPPPPLASFAGGPRRSCACTLLPYLFDFRRINIYFLFCRTNSVRDLIFV
jgi:hypothetical protein